MTPVIEAIGVSKRYEIGKMGYGSFKKDFQSLTAKLMGRPDPNRRLDEKLRSEKEFMALQDVSFQVQPGDRLGIIGANGAGKSTLLKILSRVTLPSKGEIRLRGRVASLLEVGTGFHPELSGRENVFLNGAILGMSRREVKAKFDEIVDFSGVEKFIDTPVKRYSSGMYVRLAFAVAAHLEPEILIIDEVLAVGDALFQKKCLGKMQSVATDEGRTVIFVSHSMGTVSALCNRTIFLKEGRVAHDGSTPEAINLYLESFFVNESSATYAVDESKQAQILDVNLLDHRGNPSTAIDITKPFSIDVGYQVHQAISGTVISAAIFTNNNECLVSTCDFDLDREKLETRRPGLYRSRVKFPADIFNTGQFSIVIGISIPGRVIYDRKEAMKFEFVDGGSFVASGGGEERRNSYLLMPLRWESLD